MGLQMIEHERLAPFHRKLNLLSASGTFLDGYDLAVVGVALPLLVKHFDLGAGMTGVLASSVLIGNFVGMIIFGWLTDKIGRRAMYVIDLLTFVVFAAMTAISTNIWEMLLFRFLLGLGIGADYTISPTLVAEFNPTQRRGGRVGMLTLTFFIGSLVSYFIGLAASPLGPSAWRYMMGFGALLALVVLFFRRQIPESPRWLVSQGETGKASDIVHSLTGERPNLEATKPVAASWSRLFVGTVAKWTAFVCLFWFAWDVLYYGVGLFSPTILKAAAHGSYVVGILGAISITLVSIIGCLVAMYVLVDKWGRRPSLILGFAGLTAALLVLALSGHPTFAVLVVLLDLGIFLGNLGPGILPWIYATDLFPTELRAAGTGVGAAAGRIGGILGVLVFPELIKAWGVAHASFLFVAAGLLGLIVDLFMAPETKQKPLERIQAELGGEPGMAAVGPIIP